MKKMEAELLQVRTNLKSESIDMNKDVLVLRSELEKAFQETLSVRAQLQRYKEISQRVQLVEQDEVERKSNDKESLRDRVKFVEKYATQRLIAAKEVTHLLTY